MADTIDDVATQSAGQVNRHGFRVALIRAAPAVCEGSVVGVLELSGRDHAQATRGVHVGEGLI